jgi:small subunit ribosomal protein S20
MAHTLSALKRIRQSQKRRLRNMSFMSRTKTKIKEFIDAINRKEKEIAQKLFIEVQSLIDRAKSKGVLHKKTASRMKSKLARKLNALLTS